MTKSMMEIFIMYPWRKSTETQRFFIQSLASDV